MKVINKIVIDILSGDVIEEESFEYSGSISLCKGGGGGSTAGKVEYPAYMVTAHNDWLDRAGAAPGVAVGESMEELMAAAIGTSPYAAVTAFDPDGDITDMLQDVTDFETILDAVTPSTNWVTYALAARAEIDNNIVDNTTLAAAATAHGTVLSDMLTADVLPRYQAGMRDINAVVSTSFTIGQANIEATNVKLVADFDAKNRTASYSQRNEMVMRGADAMVTTLNLQLEFAKALAHVSVESRRIKVVMKMEEQDSQLEFDAKDGRWDLDTYQYGSNVLSSISGSAISAKDVPKKGSMLGGALSGAAAGALIAGPWGAVIGGIGGALFG